MMLNRNPPKINSYKTVKILVVEDEKIIALNVRESLESLGYIVPAIADSGEKAIEKATQLRPDLVLMDIRLKGNMDGIQAAEQIWNSMQIPVIYVTGHSDKSTLERAKITVPFGYILKPVKEQELYVAIETALQRYEREQLLSAILKGMGDGVILVNPQGRVQFLNQVAESLTGWRQDEARDREFIEVFKIVSEQTQQPVNNPVTAALQQDTTVYLEDRVLLLSKNGTPIPIGDSAAPVKDNKGVITGVVLVFRDITQRRLAEERNLAMERARYLELQIAELQRLNQLKDDFLSTVSHELRTPLSNIKMAVRLLETVLDQQSILGSQTHFNSQSMNRYLKILEDQCNQELMLVNDLLDMRAIDADAYPLELTSIELQNWIPHIVESFEARTQTQQQNLQVSLPPELPPLVSDLSSLTRILSELLNNACKYTPAGEQIVVTVQVISEDKENQGDKTVESLPSSPLTPALRCPPRGVQIDVSNSGVEIPTEELARIFDPFYRIPKNDPWKYGGTGLGLSLVKKLLVRLQGNLDVTSTQGWTTFRLFLPNLELPFQEVDCDFD
ncbi:hybrid sensor histidine kinase/response regulator [Allocoleopsis franciscana]|uniref:histidine kinase n=1 Tax=Allocoleopsis franciscana PCC 7113 TaxID=1173027 RepID=K9WJC1_9CYAN|nr:hybrid sensor histidine kinase/response regulator [Allocoleopsis franciscana]AFZ20505.1 PAS/PAC sensor hybrid histidine kinase [Allocoleopsis franciscana PCC 7113]